MANATIQIRTDAMVKEAADSIFRSLAGKYKDCAFSTERLFEERQQDRERENTKRPRS